MNTLTPIPPKSLTVETTLENEILLCCARTYMDVNDVERLRILLPLNIDWEYLIETATHHGLMPLLYWNLNTICPELVPKTSLAQLKNSFCANVCHNLALMSELLEILDFLALHEIPAIPFKGISLAVSIYGNIALRQFGDIDILVDESNGNKAKELLASQKYQLVDKLLITQQGMTPITLDLQWRITRREFGINLDFEDLWQRKQSLTLVGTKITTLSPEDLLLLLCIHGSKHLWERIIWICDIAELIRVHSYLDWEKVIKQASKKGCQRMLFLGLLLANTLLKTTLPIPLLQRINADSIAQFLVIQITERLFSTVEKSASYRGESNIFFIRMRERLQDRIRFFILTQGYRWLIPNEKDREFFPLPKSFYFLYYLIRPIRLVKKYGLSPLKHLFKDS